MTATPADTLQVTRRPEAVDIPDVLTPQDAARVGAAIASSRARNTRLAYAGQWQRFSDWMHHRGLEPLPASPEQVAAYLADRAATGVRPATLRQAAAAISQAHRESGTQNPCQSEGVRRTLAGLVRDMGARPRQVAGLTADAVAAICATGHQRRDVGRGRRETPDTAAARGRVDCALVLVMRDGMLRRSEAAAATWTHIEAAPDGSGRLTVHRSKTDQDGEGATLYLSRRTMTALAAIRQDAPDDARVFGLSGSQIARRIQAAAAAAGLDGRFSGHSCRVGMARDLAATGCELPALMQAGRWKKPEMPAAYTRNESAGRGAVARYYQQQEG